MPLSAAFFYPGPSLCPIVNKITQLKACIFLHSQIYTRVVTISRGKTKPKPNPNKTHHLFLEAKLVAWISMVKWGKLYINNWFEVWMDYQKHLQIYVSFISYAVAFLCFQVIKCLKSTHLHKEKDYDYIHKIGFLKKFFSF